MNLQLLTLVASAIASSVHTLGAEEFREFLGGKDLSIVEFFAPWCGHCQALEPEYEKAGEILAAHEGAEVALAKVDCTEEAEICAEYGIRGYPTLFVFKGTEKVGSYDGPRTSEDIVSFVQRRSAPPVSYLESAAEVKALAKEEILVVGFFDKQDKLEAAYTSVADGFRDRVKFVALPAKLASEYGLKAPAVLVLKEGKEIAAESVEEPELTAFINLESFPTFGEIGPSNYLEYTQSGIPLLFAFVENEEQRNEVEEWFAPVLETLHGKANIVFLDTERFGAHAENVNIKQEWPAFVVHDIASNKKFPHPQGAPVTPESLKKWASEFSSGKIQPAIKSEPIPESQPGPVFTLVAKQYDEIVLESEEDVLVEYYAPWCGHCKTLAPIYDELAESYAGNKKVRIAKLDHTLNEVPDQIQGYPTIKLYPAGDKSNPILFDKARTLEELQKFIEQKGTHRASPLLDEALHEDL